MPLTRSDQLDDRRRRVLTEELVNAQRTAPPAVTTARGTEGTGPTDPHRYLPAAALDQQPRITDFVPQRGRALALFCTMGLACVASLGALDHYLPKLAMLAGWAPLATFDLAQGSALATWFSSLTLALAAAYALLIYTLRRHKADDFRGRYRVWLWAAGLAMFLSLDAAGTLRTGFRQAVMRLAGEPLVGDGSLWWMIALALVVLPLGLRLAIDMRYSRASLVSLLATVALFTAALSAKFNWFTAATMLRPGLLEAYCVLLGNLALLWTMCLHGRFVIFEANGLLPSPKVADASQTKRRTARKSVAAPQAAASATRRDDLAPPVSTPSAKASSPTESVQATDRDSDSETDSPSSERHQKKRQSYRIDAEPDDDASYAGGHKLDKAARKAMRREKSRARRGEAA